MKEYCCFIAVPMLMLAAIGFPESGLVNLVQVLMWVLFIIAAFVGASILIVTAAHKLGRLSSHDEEYREFIASTHESFTKRQLPILLYWLRSGFTVCGLAYLGMPITLLFYILVTAIHLGCAVLIARAAKQLKDQPAEQMEA